MNERPLSTALRPSACPGLLRIVPALDGGICRIKLSGGSISSAQAEAVADAAERFAGGVIEATNRANLQIRGIGREQAALIDSLLAAGLGPQNAAGDDVRNLMLSPSAGIDRQMLFDTMPLAEQILTTVQLHERFHDLSAKFAVQLDGGEALAMLEHPHDLWLSVFERDGERWLAFGLAGCPTDEPAGSIALVDGYNLVIAVLELFLELARPEQTRMRHLLAEIASEDFLSRLAERVDLVEAGLGLNPAAVAAPVEEQCRDDAVANVLESFWGHRVLIPGALPSSHGLLERLDAPGRSLLGRVPHEGGNENRRARLPGRADAATA